MARMILRAAVIGLWALPAVAEEPAASPEPGFEERSRGFEERIAALAAIDPLQPDTLEARLDYARLLHETAIEECLPLLDAAEGELAPILSAGEADLLAWPDGRADAMSLLQSIQNTRGLCAGDEPSARAAFQAAIATGERAVELLAENWDYEEMAIARFNVAFARRELGDLDGALADLEQVLEWDRAFGLRDDLASDYATLLRWANGEEPDPAEVERFLASFPQARARLAFAPAPHEARWRVEYERASIAAGRVLRFTTRYRTKSTLRPDGEDWLLATELLGEPEVEVHGFAGRAEPRALGELIEGIVAVEPDRVIGSDGGFKSLRNLERYRGHVAAELRRMVRGLSRAGDAPADDALLDPLVESALKTDFLAAQAGGDWNVMVGAWVGGEFDHGDWYASEFEEPLPGLPAHPVSMRWEFKVSRWLPCSERETRQCVELLLRISPDPDDVREVVAGFVAPMVPAGQRAEVERTLRATAYRLDMRYRLLTEAETLRPWEFEERTYLYGAGMEGGRRRVAVRSDRKRMTADYPD